MKPIRKLLIANRNEIACRILRAAKALGIATVAVYSEADANALHVKQADEAWCIGPAPSLESYLKIDKLIEVAKASGADAIHPGYGFVSENPDFARACEQAGITLVGPTSQAIADMADKACAKEIAQQAGLPCIPGFMNGEACASDLLAAANDMGYPVMIKALAGGGGRGMRLVESEAQFASQLHSAQLEAKNAFNDDRVMLEKAIVRPRHIEIQVLADTHGHAVHLGERDCSVQRRHQKIVEEAPSPAVSPELRQRMGEAALKLVHATDYVGAGTVEFLLDESGDFYFIEMNTRLQVEHGVTEAITGIDLVQWQLRIAAGEPLTLKQPDIQFNGHAIQGRLCAEDPARDFMPQTGKVLAWSVPSDVRCDHAIEAGLEVSPWYDSLLAKVIAHGPDRETACRKLSQSLLQTELMGFTHNADYLARIAAHPRFVNGAFSTAFLAEEAESLLAPLDQTLALAQDIAALCFWTLKPTESKAWPAVMGAFSSTRALVSTLRLKRGETLTAYSLQLEGLSTGEVSFKKTAQGEGEEANVQTAKIERLRFEQTRGGDKGGSVNCYFELDATPFKASLNGSSSGVWVRLKGASNAYWVENFSLVSDAANATGQFQPQVKSPMNGKITQVLVNKGQQVKEGDLLFCLEAMKMEHRISAKSDAMVDEVLVEVGQQMNLGQILAQLKEVA